MDQNSKRILISLGGSLLVPGEIDTEFVRSFKAFIIRYIQKGYSFIIVTGGGKTARKYIEAGSVATDITDEDKDWLGIHATRMNAHFVRTIFRDYAHPRINTNPHNLDDFYDVKEPVLVAAGWRPGRSTDYVSVLLAKYLDVVTLINMSDIDYVYEKDPRKFPEAKKYESMTWEEFRQVVGDTWSPGMNAPFDPIAATLAAQEKMRVIIVNGSDFENLERYMSGDPFEGTIIHEQNQ